MTAFPGPVDSGACLCFRNNGLHNCPLSAEGPCRKMLRDKATPEPGERWRTTYVIEGVVESVSSAGVVSFVGRCTASLRSTNPALAVQWERLPDPEPDWKYGDVVRDAIGNVYECVTLMGRPRTWKATGEKDLLNDHAPERPLTRLVAEA